MLCAMGILAALYQRMATGRGQHIQIAMRDAMLNYCRTPMSRQAARNDVLPRGGNGVVGTAPGGLYKCAPGGLDDWCYIFCSRGNEDHWRRLVRAIGREDLLADPRMADGHARFKNQAAVDAAITEWTSKRTQAGGDGDHRRGGGALRGRSQYAGAAATTRICMRAA